MSTHNSNNNNNHSYIRRRRILSPHNNAHIIIAAATLIRLIYIYRHYINKYFHVNRRQADCGRHCFPMLRMRKSFPMQSVLVTFRLRDAAHARILQTADPAGHIISGTTAAILFIILKYFPRAGKKKIKSLRNVLAYNPSCKGIIVAGSLVDNII